MLKITKIFCDLDNTLLDLYGRCREFGITNKVWEDKPDLAWSIIDNVGTDFWRDMPWMPGGKDLLSYLCALPVPVLLLSAVPNASPSRRLAEHGKRVWKARACISLDMILCLRKYKASYCTSTSLLIDDYNLNVQDWREAGGIAIEHKSACDTLAHLEMLQQHFSFTRE